MMHPEILKLYEKTKIIYNYSDDLYKMLQFLKDCGATKIQAFLTLIEGFNLSVDEVDEAIIKANLWFPVDIEQDFIEMATYKSQSR